MTDQPKYRYRKTWRGKLVLQELRYTYDYDMYGSFDEKYVYEDVIVKGKSITDDLVDKHISSEYPLPK